MKRRAALDPTARRAPLRMGESRYVLQRDDLEKYRGIPRMRNETKNRTDGNLRPSVLCLHHGNGALRRSKGTQEEEILRAAPQI